MRLHLFIAATAFLLGGSIATVAQSLTWEPLGPASGVYGGLCIDSGGTIYAYKWEGGIVRSTDMGANWTLVAPYVLGSLVAGGRDTVYHVDEDFMLRRSIDAGLTWQTLSDRITTIAIGPDGQLYATRGRYYDAPTTLFRFDAQGVASRVDGPAPAAMALLGTNGSGALFGLGANLLFRSDDRGASWRTVMTGVGEMPEFFGPGPAGRLYFVNDDSKVFRSTDDGLTWLKTGEITGRTGIVMGTAVGDDGAIYIGQGDRKFMRSTDEGATWSVRSAETVTTLMRVPGGLLGGLLSQLMSRTTDGGVTWTSSSAGLPGQPVTAVVVTSDSAAVTRIGASLRMTVHAGDSIRWFGGMRTLASDFMRSNDGRVFIFDVFTRRVYRTADEGATWDSSAVADSNFRALLAVDREGRLVGALAGLYRSTDLGDTWIALDTSTAEFVSAVAIDSSGRIVAGRGRGLVWFDEANRRWEPFASFPEIGSGVKRIVVMPDGTLLVLARTEGIYRSVDAGVTWTRLGITVKGDIAVSRAGLLVVIDGERILASHDRGTTLFEIGRDLGFGALALSISPDGRIFVGTQFGLFRSTEPVLSAPLDDRTAGRGSGLAPATLHPNPAHGHTELTYVLQRRASLRVTIVDASGRELLCVIDEVRDAGAGRVMIDLGTLPAGAYIVQLKADNAAIARRLIKL